MYHHELHLVIDLDIMQVYINALLPNTTYEERCDPSISPFYKDVRGLKLPPALFTCGSEDLLLDGTVIMGAEWGMWGMESVVKIYNGAPHGVIAFTRGVIKAVDEGLEDTVTLVEKLVQ